MPNALDLDASVVISAWCRSDLGQAVLPADRNVIEGSMAVRSLIVDLVLSDGARDELYDACAVLGRLMAQRASSPTLASATIDHAADALGARGATWVAAARAALAEGFASILVEEATRAAMKPWEFPGCVVPLGEARIAIAAGHPSDDDEVLAAWSARVAKAAALRGARHAVVAGGARARAAVVDALSLLGIEVSGPQAGSRT